MWTAHSAYSWHTVNGPLPDLWSGRGVLFFRRIHGDINGHCRAQLLDLSRIVGRKG